MLRSVLSLSLALCALSACSSTSPEPSATGTTEAVAQKGADYAKAGFTVIEEEGRLWVFRDGSPELAEYRKSGELAKCVTRIGVGPDGMTIKAPDAATIDAFLAR